MRQVLILSVYFCKDSHVCAFVFLSWLKIIKISYQWMLFSHSLIGTKFNEVVMNSMNERRIISVKNNLLLSCFQYSILITNKSVFIEPITWCSHPDNLLSQPYFYVQLNFRNILQNNFFDPRPFQLLKIDF